MSSKFIFSLLSRFSNYHKKLKLNRNFIFPQKKGSYQEIEKIATVGISKSTGVKFNILITNSKYYKFYQICPKNGLFGLQYVGYFYILGNRVFVSTHPCNKKYIII